MILIYKQPIILKIQIKKSIKTSTMDIDKMKIPTTFQQNSNFSQQQNRVFYKKYINEINEALQSLITVGRIKRMELLSINNRALFNRGKVQRCQWTAKKHISNNSIFLPDVKNLNLDNRSPKNQKRSKKRNKTEARSPNTSRYEQKFVDMLIEEELNRLKENNLLKANRSQSQIVKQACRAIEQRIILKNNQNKKNQQKLIPINRRTIHNKFTCMRKDHRRSVTQAVYSQQIQQIEKRNQAIMKQREEQKKFFLRKMKISNIKKKKKGITINN